MKTLEMYDAELKALDLLIARSQALIDARDDAALAPVESSDSSGITHDATCYAVEARPLAFGLPISHTEGWEHLGSYVLTSAAILPGDSRWSKGGLRCSALRGRARKRSLSTLRHSRGARRNARCGRA